MPGLLMTKPISDLPFELEGDLSWPCEADMAAFAEAASNHQWAGAGPERVVVSDDLVATMQKYMPAAQFEEWLERQRARHDGSGALGVGMAFVASDGKRTAVLAKLGTKEQTLWLYGHEYMEAAISERETRRGFSEPRDAEMRHGRALWGEYVVERARREIAAALGWPPGDLDRSYLTASARDAQQAPGEQQTWPYVVLTLDFAKALARSDAGVAAESSEIEGFFEMSLANAAWADYARTLQRIYEYPDTDPTQHDDATFQAWARIWRARP